MDNSVRPNLRYCIIIIKVKAIAEGRRKFGNGFCNGCNGCQEEGSSATDSVTDVTDVKDVRKQEDVTTIARVSLIKDF
ncbi:hypothetical protein QUA71_14615 [Microcoleus sp. MON1_C5]|uniref:hypothetical protein n=1 Tax=Microcoleus sp. MON1_C5 TaxID=2818828 RepID=UPI002FD349EE